MLITTHETQFGREISDRSACFRRGKFVEIGLPRHMFEAAKDERAARFLGRIAQ